MTGTSRGPAIVAFAGLLATLAVGVAILLAPATRLLVGGLDAASPVWSPTGERLAFLVHDSIGVHVAVYDFAHRMHRIAGSTSGEDATAFSWSPDGRQLAYTGPDITGDGRDVIQVYDVESGASHPLAAASSPQWRADGSIVAVCGPERPEFDADADEAEGLIARVAETDTRFCRIDVGTGEVSRTALAFAPGMTVSPLLDRVLVRRAAGTGPELSVASLDGQAPVPIDAGRIAAASWTMAGDRILVAAQDASGAGFWTMRADGSERRRVLPGVTVADPASVRLSADGTLAFFIAPVDGDPLAAQLTTGGAPADLHMAPAGGGAARRIATRQPFKRRFAVSPDAKSVAYEILTGVRRPGGPGKREIWLVRRPERPD